MSKEYAEDPDITVMKALSYEKKTIEVEIFLELKMSGGKINLEKSVH